MEWRSWFFFFGNISGPFSGSFDGDGYNINNLYMNQPFADFMGLFGNVLGSNISNVSLSNSSIGGQFYVGCLIGQSYNSNIQNNFINNCSVVGMSSVGGLVGQSENSSEINNSVKSSNITGLADSGGLVGYQVGGFVNNSFVVLTNISGDNYVGGLIGRTNGSIDSCFVDNFSFINVEANDSGGLVGSLGFVDNGGGIINNSYTGDSVYVLASTNLISRGGLVGINDKSKIFNSYSAANVSFPNEGDYGGGFVGFINNSGGYEDLNNLWDINSSGWLTSSGNSIGKTTIEMKSFETYNSSNWDILLFNDFNNNSLNKWFIKNNSDSPQLSFQYIPRPVFVNIPSNDSLVFGESWEGVLFNVSASLDFDYSINDSDLFNINESGFLNWTNPLNASSYYINISLNDSEDRVVFLIYNLNITKKELNVSGA